MKTQKYSFCWTMPADMDPSEPDFPVTFLFTPGEPSKGYHHPNDPDYPASPIIEDIQIVLGDHARWW